MKNQERLRRQRLARLAAEDDFDLQKHQLKTVLRNLEQAQLLLGWAQETYTEAMGAGDYWIGLCRRNVD